MERFSRVARDGVVVGLIAYLSVAVFYAVFDLLAARGSLYTVNLLGRALFRGLRDPGVLFVPVQLDPGAIFLYNGLHLLASLGIGFIVVSLIARAERNPSQAAALLTVIVAGFLVTIVAVGLLSAPLRPVLPWWSIVVANSVAVVAAATFLLQIRPGLARRLLRSPVEASLT